MSRRMYQQNRSGTISFSCYKCIVGFVFLSVGLIVLSAVVTVVRKYAQLSRIERVESAGGMVMRAKPAAGTGGAFRFEFIAIDQVRQVNPPAGPLTPELFEDVLNLGAVILVFDDTDLGDDRVAQLARNPNLKALHLSRTTVTFNGLRSLSRTANLEDLILEETDLTSGDASNVRGFHKLGVFSMDGGSIGNLDLNFLDEARGLVGLGLSRTNITDKALLTLPKLPQLQWLSLDGTALNGEGLDGLARLPKLKRIILDDTRIEDRHLAHLAKCPALQYLSIENTSVTDEGLRHLSQISTLRGINLGTVPK